MSELYRGNVVVEDKAAANQQGEFFLLTLHKRYIDTDNVSRVGDSQDENTSIYIPKAEPGRDIFAEAPVKDIRSQNIPQPPKAPEEEKLISSVVPDAPKDNKVVGEDIVGEGKYIGQTAKDDQPKVNVEQEAETVQIQTAPPVPIDNEGVDPVIPPGAKDAKDERVRQAKEEGEKLAKERAEEKANKQAGPLGEADAAVDKVAKELYPEDAD